MSFTPSHPSDPSPLRTLQNLRPFAPGAMLAKRAQRNSKHVARLTMPTASVCITPISPIIGNKREKLATGGFHLLGILRQDFVGDTFRARKLEAWGAMTRRCLRHYLASLPVARHCDHEPHRRAGKSQVRWHLFQWQCFRRLGSRSAPTKHLLVVRMSHQGNCIGRKTPKDSCWYAMAMRLRRHFGDPV